MDNTLSTIGIGILKRVRVGLSVAAENVLREKLRTTTCSEPWIDAQFVEAQHADERGDVIVQRSHDPSAYPPGGKETAMVKCPLCGVFNPPNAMEAGVCLDHVSHGNWGPSPSAYAIFKLQLYGVQQRDHEQIEIKPERNEDLKREIRRYLRRSSKSHPSEVKVNFAVGQKTKAP